MKSVRTNRENVGFGHTSRSVIRSARYHQEPCPSAVVCDIVSDKYQHKIQQEKRINTLTVVVVHKIHEALLDRHHRARICGERMGPKLAGQDGEGFQEVAIARA